MKKTFSVFNNNMDADHWWSMWATFSFLRAAVALTYQEPMRNFGWYSIVALQRERRRSNSEAGGIDPYPPLVPCAGGRRRVHTQPLPSTNPHPLDIPNPERDLDQAYPPPPEGTWDQGYPPPFGQTNASENITFPQLRWRVIMKMVKF